MSGSDAIDMDVWRLLPWLANDTLEGEELERVLDHLKRSPRCRAELLFLSELRHAVELSRNGSLEVPEERLRGLMDRIDTHERRRPADRSARRRWLPLAAAVLLLAGAAWWMTRIRLEPASAEPVFRTLSADRPVAATAAGPADQPRLWLIPAPGLAEADLRRLVLELGAEIVAGPSAGGVYTLGWRPAEPGAPYAVPATDELAARLRSDPRVALAEPVRGP